MANLWCPQQWFDHMLNASLFLDMVRNLVTCKQQPPALTDHMIERAELAIVFCSPVREQDTRRLYSGGSPAAARLDEAS